MGWVFILTLIPPLTMKQYFPRVAVSEISVEIFTSEDEWQTATTRYLSKLTIGNKSWWYVHVEIGTFSAWSVKHGTMKRIRDLSKFIPCWSQREKCLDQTARAITIIRFYTTSLNQTQSCSFQRFYGYKWYQKIIKLAYVIAESSNYTSYTQRISTNAELCPIPGFAMGILP